MFNSQDIIAAYTGWFQFQMYICINFYRFFDSLHLFQHLFTAFGTFDGFFAVERTKLFDNRDVYKRQGEYLLLGKGEDATGGRKRESVTSDAMEALIGAIYLDGGFANAKEFIHRFILKDLELSLIHI